MTAGETLTISGGSAATGVAVTGQDYKVSNGPYRMPDNRFGNPPFRKLVGVTSLTDAEVMGVPPSTAFNGFDDYGIFLSGGSGRSKFYPYRYNAEKQEIMLVSSNAPEITTTTGLYGASGTVINTSKLRWVYYVNPPPVTSISDESSIVLPERYRHEILYKGITLLANEATYGDAMTLRQIIEPLCERFWEDMRYQYQQYGRDSDYISEGDSWDYQRLGIGNQHNSGIYRRGSLWG